MRAWDGLDDFTHDLVNHAVFCTHVESGRGGALIERSESGHWDVSYVSAWDDARESERRSEQVGPTIEWVA